MRLIPNIYLSKKKENQEIFWYIREISTKQSAIDSDLAFFKLFLNESAINFTLLCQWSKYENNLQAWICFRNTPSGFVLWKIDHVPLICIIISINTICN